MSEIETGVNSLSDLLKHSSKNLPPRYTICLYVDYSDIEVYWELAQEYAPIKSYVGSFELASDKLCEAILHAVSAANLDFNKRNKNV